MAHPALSRPPIREAVVEIHLPFPVSEKEVRDLSPAFPGFGQASDIQGLEMQLHVEGPVVDSKASKEFVGLRFVSAEQTEIIQIQRASFSYHRLGPYPGWDSFVDAFSTHWNSVSTAWPIEWSPRIGVRFINDVQLLELPANLSAYVRLDLTATQSRWPARGLFWKTDMDMSDGIIGSLTVATAAGLDPAARSLVLDLDIIATGKIPAARIMDRLVTIRALKNELFFAIITDKVIELCS